MSRIPLNRPTLRHSRWLFDGISGFCVASSPSPRFLRLALIAPLMIGAIGCRSAPPKDLEITYENLRRGQRIALVNRSHSEFLNIQERTSSSASTKVVDDSDLFALVDELESLGFEEYGRPLTERPTQSNDFGWADFITIQRDDDTQFVRIPIDQTTATRDEVLAIVKLKTFLLSAYNSAVSYQSVENETGTTMFYRQQNELIENTSRVRQYQLKRGQSN